MAALLLALAAPSGLPVLIANPMLELMVALLGFLALAVLAIRYAVRRDDVLHGDFIDPSER